MDNQQAGMEVLSITFITYPNLKMLLRPRPPGHSRNYFMKFASAAQAGSISLSNTGYPYYIDIPSFIHYIIIAEISSNADSYGLSTYFHKDRNGKLRAGPVWDRT